MNQNYYKLPFNTSSLVTNKKLERCDLKQSIAYSIHLINTSYFGECVFDETYGCCLWDIDFDNLSSSTKIKEAVRKSLLDSLKIHEKRLTSIRIIVGIKQEEFETAGKSALVKKKVSITVKAKVKKTNEDYVYNEFFFIGPLSY